MALDFSQGDTLYVHADTVRMRAWNVNTDSVYREVYGVDNVRAYRTDIQAVCGLLVANTLDSCITLYDDPVLWNGERQILGDSIRAFMNDSTVRDVYVMGNALSIERMTDREHFNQISAKSMHAHFIDGAVRQATAVDNVLTIFYPTDDKDSTLIGMVYVETDTMRMFLSPERKLEKIWMPKTEGMMYPLNQIPPEHRQLRGFVWLENLRPRDKDDVFRRVTKAQSLQRLYRKVAAPPRQRIVDRFNPERHDDEGTFSSAKAAPLLPPLPVYRRAQGTTAPAQGGDEQRWGTKDGGQGVGPSGETAHALCRGCKTAPGQAT